MGIGLVPGNHLTAELIALFFKRVPSGPIHCAEILSVVGGDGVSWPKFAVIVMFCVTLVTVTGLLVEENPPVPVQLTK